MRTTSLRAIFFRDLFDGNAHLVAKVSAGIHNTICPFAKDHFIAIFTRLIDVLKGQK